MNGVMASPGERFDRLDVLRALAIVWMALFHFCFDLNHFRLLTPVQAFTRDPFWTTQRTCIVTLFMFCAGLSQAVALSAGQGWSRFWKRWAQVAGCALLVTAGSALMFPQTYITFGVLHGLAVMLLLTRWLAPRLSWAVLLPLALACIALPRVWRHAFFNTPWTNWVGLSSSKPFTEDYVPLLPWWGVMLLGLLAGRWVLQHRRHWLTGAVPRGAKPLAVLGRWSLSFYMLHQPVFIGVLMGGRALGWW